MFVGVAAAVVFVGVAVVLESNHRVFHSPNMVQAHTRARCFHVNVDRTSSC